MEDLGLVLAHLLLAGDDTTRHESLACMLKTYGHNQLHRTQPLQKSAQSNLAKGRIADLSPLAAVNGFVPSITWFLGST